jgi:predicted RNA-binding Zn-ribbon protein involved in translation (DUF1610 family)
MTFLLAGAAGGLAWLGSAMGGNPLRQVVWVVGLVLAVMAIGMIVWTAAARSRADAARRSVGRYACPRCGYSPEPGDLDDSVSTPCPVCGRPMYEH